MLQGCMKFESPKEEKKELHMRKLRSEVDVSETWNVEALYATPEAWEEDWQKLLPMAQELSKYQGRLNESGPVLKTFLDGMHACDALLMRVYLYSNLCSDVDTTNSVHLGRKNRSRQLIADVLGCFAFVQPELVKMDWERIEEMMKEEPELELYRQYLDDTMRRREFTLSEEVERILAEASPIFNQSSDTFTVLNNASLSFPPISDEKGETIPVNHASFGLLLENPNRDIRFMTFESVYSTYKQFEQTFASTLSGVTKKHNFLAKLRGFDSARAAALHDNNIPVSIHQNLLDTVHQHLHLLHDYVAFRKEKLGYSEIYPFDLYIPIVDSVQMKFTIPEAQKIVLEALKPLGEEYVSVIRQGFEDRWIDWADNEGKRSGAYSSGCQGSFPYILLNWKGTLDNLYTLVHELGHSMHSYLTWKNQPCPYAQYSIFLAEIASTTNEILLTQYFLKNNEDPKVRAYILNQYLDGVKGTVFRQTQFAEFELLIHEAQAKGIPLTPDWLCEQYLRLNQEYYGSALSDKGHIAYEWERIPHFYYDFYVYQYATGFSAATAFARSILEEGEAAVTRYLRFLSSGSSKYPIETLQDAGVDMSSPEPIARTLEMFGQYLEEYKALLR